MSKDHLHMEFAPGWLLEDANSLSCGACPHHRLVQVNMGAASMRFTFEAFQAFTSLMQRMADQISQVEPVTAPSPFAPAQPYSNSPAYDGGTFEGPAFEGGGKVISGLFPQREH